jgi:hypothetical protein
MLVQAQSDDQVKENPFILSLTKYVANSKV